MARTIKPKYNHSFPLMDDKDFLSLSPKHQKFIYLYYLKPISKATNAEIYRAAYNRPDQGNNPASVGAHNLLKHPNIAPHIHKLTLFRIQQLNLTTERLMEEESYIAKSDFGELFDESGLCIMNPKHMPMPMRRAIRSIETIQIGNETRYKITLWDKGMALKRLEDIQGLIKPKRLELTGPKGDPIEINHNVKVDLSKLSKTELQVLKKLISTQTKEE